MNKRNTILISLGILIVSAGITVLVFATEPEAKREGATVKTAMLVDIEVVEKGSYTPTVVATGNVQAAKDISLSPRVSGEITSLSTEFVPGSYVKKGQKLLQIDPADYINTVKLRESDLQLAEADLKVEMGRQDVAQKDYELVGAELAEENKSLVLRKPQLQSAKANVQAAKASLKQAQLDLDRSTVRAPFDAHIISRNVNEGSQVTPNNVLGRLVGLDEYWVIANIPLNKVARLSFSEDMNTEGARVKIMNRNAWGLNKYRIGTLSKLIGALDDQTRLARVVITVKDPLAREIEADSIPKLIVGTFVETHIEAQELKNVVKLSRDYLRKNNTVWTMEEGKLSIKKVEVVFEDSNFAYIRSGLEDGAQIVTTNLSTVVEGSRLRTEGEDGGTE